MKSRAKRNCILGYAVGLKEDDVRLFCESALLSMKEPTDIVLFCSDTSSSHGISQHSRVVIIPTNNLWIGIEKDHYRLKWGLAFAFMQMFKLTTNVLSTTARYLFKSKCSVESFSAYFLHPSLARYVLYKEYIRINEGSYKSILMADVRDVYFQDDPFVDLPSGLTTFLENSSMLCSETRNRRWIRSVYGKKVANEMNQHRAICSGVSLGDATSVQHYLAQICSELDSLGCIPYSDQGIHNVLIRLKGLQALLADNSAGLTLTAAGIETFQDFKIQGGKVCALNNKVFSIIHQYDRHAILKDTLQHEHTRRIAVDLLSPHSSTREK